MILGAPQFIQLLKHQVQKKIWLVVLTVLKNMRVNGKDDPIYGKNDWNHQSELQLTVPDLGLKLLGTHHGEPVDIHVFFLHSPF